VWRWVSTPSIPTFWQCGAENSQFCRKYIHNYQTRKCGSLICKLSGTPDQGVATPRSPFSRPSVPNWIGWNPPPQTIKLSVYATCHYVDFLLHTVADGSYKKERGDCRNATDNCTSIPSFRWASSETCFDKHWAFASNYLFLLLISHFLKQNWTLHIKYSTEFLIFKTNTCTLLIQSVYPYTIWQNSAIFRHRTKVVWQCYEQVGKAEQKTWFHLCDIAGNKSPHDTSLFCA
jgi:hypothetical protein